MSIEGSYPLTATVKLNHPRVTSRTHLSCHERERKLTSDAVLPRTHVIIVILLKNKAFIVSFRSVMERYTLLEKHFFSLTRLFSLITYAFLHLDRTCTYYGYNYTHISAFNWEIYICVHIAYHYCDMYINRSNKMLISESFVKLYIILIKTFRCLCYLLIILRVHNYF